MTRQTTCDPQRIDLFLDQKLSDEEQSAFESHLSACGDCRQRLETTAASEDISIAICESLREFSPLPPGEGPGTDGAPACGSRWSMRAVDFVLDSTTGEETFSSQATVLKLLAPTDDDRMLGRWGTYEVVGVVGTGGMGVVLKAFDTALNRYVAIKILAPHLGSSGAARKRFSREAQASAAVVHDNVIEIYGVAEAAGLPYLVMPYVRGPSLQRRLDDEGPLAVVEILRVGMQAAAGLAAAHAQGLVHRDVKPANILLADGIERVKLTDFGLAHVQQPTAVPLPDVLISLRRDASITTERDEYDGGQPTSSPLPPGEGQGVRVVDSALQREGQTMMAADAHRPRPLAGWSGKKRILTVAIALLSLFGGLWLAFGIIIHLKKDGKTTTVDVPEGSTAHIDTQGAVTVELPSSPGAASADGGSGAESSLERAARRYAKEQTAKARDALVRKYEKLLEAHPGGLEGGKTMLSLASLWQSSRNPDHKKELAWLRKACAALPEGSPEWFEAQFRLFGAIYLDQPEEARRILRLLIAKSPDLRWEVKGYYWLQVVASVQGKFDEMESIALKLQNIDLNSSRMPKELLAAGEVYQTIQNSQRSLMYRWAEMLDVPRREREAKIRAFAEKAHFRTHIENDMAGALEMLSHFSGAEYAPGNASQAVSGLGRPAAPAAAAIRMEENPGGPWTAILPGDTGVFLEDVGGDGRWWRPDGSLTEKAPSGEYEERGFQSSHEKAMRRTFFVRVLTSMAEPCGLTYDVTPRSELAGPNTFGLRALPHSVTPLGFAAWVPETARTVTVRVGITTGPWEDAWSAKFDESGKMQSSSSGRLADLGGEIEVQDLGNDMVLVTNVKRQHVSPPRDELRALGIRRDGPDIEGFVHFQGEKNELKGIMAIFPDYSLKHFKEIKLQRRPYTWIEFRDAAVQQSKSATKGNAPASVSTSEGEGKRVEAAPIATQPGTGQKHETKWTPENIKKDPVGHLHWAIDQTNATKTRLEAARLALTQQSRDLSDKLLKVSSDMSNYQTVLTEIEEAYLKADKKNDWPVAVRNHKFDKNELKRKIVECSADLENANRLAQTYSTAKSKVTDRLDEIDSERTKLETVRRKLTIDLEAAKVRQTTEGIGKDSNRDRKSSAAPDSNPGIPDLSPQRKPRKAGNDDVGLMQRLFDTVRANKGSIRAWKGTAICEFQREETTGGNTYAEKCARSIEFATDVARGRSRSGIIIDALEQSVDGLKRSPLPDNYAAMINA